MVDQYTFLGTMIDNKLKFDVNTDTICKKGQQRWYLLRTLNSFNVDKVMLSLFYKSFIESVLTFSLFAWYGGISLRDKNNLSHIVKVAGKLIGCITLRVERQGFAHFQSQRDRMLQQSGHTWIQS